MGKIPSYLNPSDDSEMLTDLVLHEWTCLGMHMNEVHAWACGGHRDDDDLWDRVYYLLEVTEDPEGLHREVRQWRSIALMTLNLLRGGGVPRRLYPAEFS